MNAATVIDEIKHLAPAEQAKVVRFVYELDAANRLTGNELSALARRMTQSRNASERSVVREEIVRGFYGDEDNAENPPQ